MCVVVSEKLESTFVKFTWDLRNTIVDSYINGSEELVLWAIDLSRLELVSLGR